MKLTCNEYSVVLLLAHCSCRFVPHRMDGETCRPARDPSLPGPEWSRWTSCITASSPTFAIAPDLGRSEPMRNVGRPKIEAYVEKLVRSPLAAVHSSRSVFRDRTKDESKRAAPGKEAGCVLRSFRRQLSTWGCSFPRPELMWRPKNLL
jgi:hypothetical protein